MSLYNGPPRGGTRGGKDQFSWDNVKADKDREYYLGHSVKALTGRWQKGILSYSPSCSVSVRSECHRGVVGHPCQKSQRELLAMQAKMSTGTPARRETMGLLLLQSCML